MNGKKLLLFISESRERENFPVFFRVKVTVKISGTIYFHYSNRRYRLKMRNQFYVHIFNLVSFFSDFHCCCYDYRILEPLASHDDFKKSKKKPPHDSNEFFKTQREREVSKEKDVDKTKVSFGIK